MRIIKALAVIPMILFGVLIAIGFITPCYIYATAKQNKWPWELTEL